MKEKDRLKRDSAGIGPEPRRAGLHKMSGLKGFRVARGEPDIRGWEVRTLNGRDVGEVDDLLVDPESGEVVFMEVAMNNSDRHIELAIRNAQLDREKKRVIVDSGDVAVHGSEYDPPPTREALSPEMRADADEELPYTGA
jgi:sporulation protein YlmC with PRC-barrel domain